MRRVERQTNPREPRSRRRIRTMNDLNRARGTSAEVYHARVARRWYAEPA